MDNNGRILIADDEESFRSSTADLLTCAGYEVEQAPDAAAALELLGEREFDVLISDIKMPGNPNLELVRQISNELPVILVTGYPDLSTAVDSVGLAVSAYLIKPFELDALLQAIRHAVSMSRASRGLAAMRQRLGTWQDELQGEDTAKLGAGTIDAFVTMTVRNITGSLLDLQKVTAALASSDEITQDAKRVCHLMECPRLTFLINAIGETIATLERTKAAFKSRELGELRHYLERIQLSAKV